MTTRTLPYTPAVQDQFTQLQQDIDTLLTNLTQLAESRKPSEIAQTQPSERHLQSLPGGLEATPHLPERIAA